MSTEQKGKSMKAVEQEVQALRLLRARLAQLEAGPDDSELEACERRDAMEGPLRSVAGALSLLVFELGMDASERRDLLAFLGRLSRLVFELGGDRSEQAKQLAGALSGVEGAS